MKAFRGALLVPLTLAALACGPSVGAPDHKIDAGPGGGPHIDGGYTGCVGSACVNACPTGQSTSIAGVVTLPNGIDPVDGAIVYVPQSVTEFPDQVACEVCNQIVDQAAVSAVTAADGTFTLNYVPTPDGSQPGDTVGLVVQKGRFRRVVDVPVQTWCGANTPDEQYFRLPGHNDPGGYDRIPKMAVAAGDYDLMECVLKKMGIEDGQFDLYDDMARPHQWSNVPKFDALLKDAAKMKTYNVIFIDCAHNTYEDLLNTTPAIKANIEDYVASGGRLYVTDWSYDYIEQITNFAPVIDFEPDASSAAPELMNAAAIGDDSMLQTGPVTGQVLDGELAAWMTAVQARRPGQNIISAQKTVQIDDLLGGWVMQKSVEAMSANPDITGITVWIQGQVQGTVSYDPNHPLCDFTNSCNDVKVSGMMPLTTSFDYKQCGRVLYTSYHTSGRAYDNLTGDVDLTPYPAICSSNSGFTPQEHALEYMILHVAGCLEPVQ